MCPFCLSPEVPLEIVGDFGTRRCSLCDRVFTYRDIKNRGYEIDVVDYFETWQEVRDRREEEIRLNGDEAVENIVRESIENLMHEIKMIKVFRKKKKKEEVKKITTELDKLFETIFDLS